MRAIKIYKLFRHYTIDSQTSLAGARKIASCLAGTEAVVVELGASNGNITHALLDRIGERGVIFAFEIDPIAVQVLTQMGDPRVVVIQENAIYFRSELLKRGVKHVDCVVSSLPVSWWGREAIINLHRDIAELIGHRGIFISVTHTALYLCHPLYRKFFELARQNYSFREPFLPLSITTFKRR